MVYFHQKLKQKLTLFKQQSISPSICSFPAVVPGLEEQSTKFTDPGVNQVFQQISVLGQNVSEAKT